MDSIDDGARSRYRAAVPAGAAGSTSAAAATGPLRVLLVDDDEDDFIETRDIIEDIPGGGYTLDWVATYEEGLDHLSRGAYDICLLDFNLGARTGLELLKEAVNRGIATPMVLLTGQNARELDVEAMRAGAYEYLIKGQVDPDLLERTVRYAIDRSRVEDELRIAKNAAEIATKAKSAFLASMSHEIRTPMNAILGMTELCLGTELSKEQQDYLRTAQSAAEALLSIINDILDLSKIEANKLTLVPTVFSLTDLVEETVAMLAARSSSPGLEVKHTVAGEMPPLLIGDPGRIRQVLVNLLGNALKFTEAGYVELQVSIDAATADEVVVRFDVADTGEGIAPDALDKIFEPFEQGAHGSKRPGGTGLGLAISRELVEMMDGRIWVESTQGVGSTFSFTARLGVPVGSYQMTALPGSELVEEFSALIVSGSPVRARSTASLLRRNGVTSTVVPDAASARTCLAERDRAPSRLRVIIADVAEEGPHLVAALAAADEDPGSLPIVAIAAAGVRGDAARLHAAGAAAYMAEPIDAGELMEALSAVVDPSREAGELITRHWLRERRRKLNILLADDSATNRAVAARLLEKKGHRVIAVVDGLEAVRAAAEHEFDVVLMDVQMPKMDGFEATATIRAREAATGDRIPIIALTAQAMQGDRERCLSAGMDAYVPKPFRAEELYSAVARLTRERPPTPRIMDAAPPIDMATALDQLEGDTDLLAELAGLFVEEFPELYGSLGAAVGAEDLAETARLAHRLKGSLGTFSALPAMAAAYELEKAGRAEDLDDVAIRWPAFVTEIERLDPEVAKLTGRNLLPG